MVVSGSGNVAIYAIEKVQQLGGKVVACSDSSGFVVDEAGIDVAVLKEIKEQRRGRISEYAESCPTARFTAAPASIWDVPCDVALPCATQNELDEDGARTLVKNGVRARGRGRQHAHHPGRAWRCLKGSGVAFAPGKAANAGGVATSALEMQQNAIRDSWSFEYTDERLGEIMRGIHRRCAEAAEEYGHPGRPGAGGEHRRLQEGRRRDAGYGDHLRAAGGPVTSGRTAHRRSATSGSAGPRRPPVAPDGSSLRAGARTLPRR